MSDFRGVEEREVVIAPTGVTVIEGPNEIGKSSMAEAIDLLIDELDSTGKRRVTATKPVGRDVGPRVEADFECGEYRFTYAKRFLRDRTTELTVRAPRHESLAGREAHERVLKILADHVDVALWKALRIRQGAGIDQADLVNQLWLSSALDKSAGTSPAGEDEKSLFGLVHDEYLEYWTETGRRKQAEVAQERAIEDLDAKHIEIEEWLRSIDGDVESSVRFQIELAELEERRTDAGSRLSEHEYRLESMASLEVDLAKAVAEAERARGAGDAARREHAKRSEVLTGLADAERDLAAVTVARDEATRLAEGYAVRIGELEAARIDLMNAVRSRSDDVQVRNDRLFAEQDRGDLLALEARIARLEAAESTAREHADAAASPIDRPAIERIRTRQRELDLACAREEAEHVGVAIQALADVRVQVGGAPARSLARGEELRHQVSEPSTFGVPDQLRITVDPGVRGAAAAEEVARRRRALDDALLEFNLEDVATAEQLFDRRAEAERLIAEARREIASALDKDTREDVSDRAATLRDRVSKLGKSTADKLTDRHALRIELDAAKLGLAEAQAKLRQVDANLEVVRQEQTTRAAGVQEASIAFRVATIDCRQRTAQLEADREASSDDMLRSALEVAEAAEEVADQAVTQAEARLLAAGIEGERILLANARDAATRIEDEVHQKREALAAVNARLADRGEDGLAERRDEVAADRDRCAVALDEYRRRASARRLLYETFKEERVASRRRYVAPLQLQIERLGQVVFGPDFGVELDDDTLRVVARTTGGITVPFESLSVGAQEQIALISRLACGMIVAPEGGIPIVLDDALGNSDRLRLEAMGAVLAMAGRECQVIVLTCQPSRYEFVGSAHVVPLQ